MPEIGHPHRVVTLTTAFIVEPGREEALVDLLKSTTDETVRRFPGFVSSTVRRARPRLAVGAAATGALAVGSLAVGALAVGALAIGALAIGRLALGSLTLKRGRVGTLALGDVTIDRLTVRELAGDVRR